MGNKMLKTVGNPSTMYGDQTIIDGSLIIGTAGAIRLAQSFNDELPSD